MNISFIWGDPPKEGLSVIETNIRDEIEHFEGRFKDFPEELIVRASMDRPQLSIEGVATAASGEAVVSISYSLLEPHRRHYQYVGKSPTI